MPISPAKIRSVARPRIFGPTAVATTLARVRASTAYALCRSGRSRASSRLSEGQKLSAFWPIMPPPIGPRPPPGPDWTRSVSLSRSGAPVGVGAGGAGCAGVVLMRRPPR